MPYDHPLEPRNSSRCCRPDTTLHIGREVRDLRSHRVRRLRGLVARAASPIARSKQALIPCVCAQFDELAIMGRGQATANELRRVERVLERMKRPSARHRPRRPTPPVC